MIIKTKISFIGGIGRHANVFTKAGHLKLLKPSFISKEYLVSDEGYVLSKNKKKHLTPYKDKKGYLLINMTVNGKSVTVTLHKLVAMAYCEGYMPGLTVNHKDGNKENCSSNNLEWITNYDNIQHAIHILGKDGKGIQNPMSKSIVGYDKNTKNLLYSFDCIMDAARYFEPEASYKRLRMIENNIWRVLSNNRKSYKNIVWKYKD